MVKDDSSKWWWIGNHNTTNFSSWLHSTLSELDEKTKEMVRVIDEEADSFAERAEMYYKKRPELISMVKEFYRSYRSLAEKYDLLKPSSVHKHGSESHEKSSTCNESTCSEAHEEYDLLRPGSVHKHGSYSHEKSPTCNESTWSEAHEEYAESEIDDGERKSVDEGEINGEDHNGNGEMMKEEIERLREENKVYSEMVREKDEEKREAIRQMSLAVQMLKEENLELKKCVSSQRKQQMWKKPFEGFWGKVGKWVLPNSDSHDS